MEVSPTTPAEERPPLSLPPLLQATARRAMLSELALLRQAPSTFPALDNPSFIRISKVPASADTPRSFYLREPFEEPGPIIAVSPFVPRALAIHLMRNKRNSAIARKWIEGSVITNMEGALHTFVTGLLRIQMHGDYEYSQGHEVVSFPEVKGFQQSRPIVMSTAIHPDFENGDVCAMAFKLSGEPTVGKALEEDFVVPTEAIKADDRTRDAYDLRLQEHLVHSLTAAHELPSHDNVTPWTIAQAISAIESTLLSPHPISPTFLANTFVISARRTILSLEMLRWTYVAALANEFSTLESLCKAAGYAYTHDPPSIFARNLDPTLMNRLFLLAVHDIAARNPLPSLSIFAFNTYADPPALELLRAALRSQPHVKVLSRAELFSGRSGRLDEKLPAIKAGATLVLHNNSDAFGQNIETEGGYGSLDGAVGEASSAAAGLRRGRADLVSFMF